VFVLVIGPTILDDEISAFDVTKVSKPLPEGGDRIILPQRRAEDAYSIGPRGLLFRLRLDRERRV